MNHLPLTAIGRYCLAVALAVLSVVFGAPFASALAQSADQKPASKPAKTAPAYPLKKSANGRYLVDQKHVPFLIAGDSPQSLMVNLSEADAELYLANRRSHGFNAVWINLLCRKGTGGRADGSTSDGILPFTKRDDLSVPNEAYFARCDRMIQLAAKYGLLVILDPCETIDHLKLMLSNGVGKCRAYGQYLGTRYKSFDNILWMSGNDLQNWKDPKVDAVAIAVALGIKDTDKRHIHTVELDYHVSSSLDDPNWAPVISLNATYTYYPTYAQVLKDYNRPNFLPVVMIEATYEFEHECTPAMLRRQEYWTNLSGATGQVYGNGVIWPFSADWKSKLDSPGAVQMAYVKALFEPRAWYDLVPDQKHAVVIAGYGTFDASTTDGNRYVMTSDYVTAGRTPDGSLVLAYMPSLRPLTVDMTKLRGPATAQWYDPSRGVYTPIKGSPFPNSGKHTFRPPGNNGDGDGDWVLVLETGTPPNVTSPSKSQALLEETEVFVGGQDDVNTYRIPSLVCTKNGTVLAFCEARQDNSKDGSPTHLVLKRSLGNARQWKPPERPVYVVPGGRSRQWNMTWLPVQTLLHSKGKEAYMNPVPVINASDGTIYLLVNYNPQYDPVRDDKGGDTHVWLLKSTDEGATWSETVDITPNVGKKELGPGVGIQTRNGRLVAPTYEGVIWSDDRGKTWKAGAKTTGPVNESQVVELVDGSLMLNTRGRPNRTVVISKDGGETWGEPRQDTVLTDSSFAGGCQASIIRYTSKKDGHGLNRLLFANPADRKNRSDLTVRLSYDEGKTWPVAKLIKKGTAAYSSMTVFPDDTIGIIYETGNAYDGVIEYGRLAFARFNLEWLTDAKDKLAKK